MDSSWRSTIYSDEPWEIAPAFSSLPGFDIRMLGLDILHLFHLGTGRDLVGSTMKVFCNAGVFTGSNIEKKLGMASTWLRTYLKQNSLKLTQLKKFSKANLNFKSLQYPEIHCKGYDTYLVLKWLVHEVVPAASQKISNDVATTLWAADKLMSMLSSADHFLDSNEMECKRVVGMIFLKTYLKLAAESLDQRKQLWRIRPKYHMLTHLVLCERRYNPHWSSTWMDEDALKRFMRIKRKTHRRTATARILQRWMLSLKDKFAQVLKRKKRIRGMVERFFTWGSYIYDVCTKNISKYVWFLRPFGRIIHGVLEGLYISIPKRRLFPRSFNQYQRILQKFGFLGFFCINFTRKQWLTGNTV